MKKNRIGFKKLVFGFVIILSIALFSAISSSLIVRDNSQTITHINNEIYPFMEKLGDFEHIVLNSKMLITNWVYLQYNDDDKAELKALHSESYPKIKRDLIELIKKAGYEKDIDSLKMIFSKMDTLLIVEKKLMTKLSSFDDYENPTTIFESEEVIESKVIPMSAEIRKMLQRYVLSTKAKNNVQRADMLQSMKTLELTAIIFGFGMFILILLSVLYIQRIITIPVLQMHDVIYKLSKGEIVTQNIKKTDDIIAQMADGIKVLSDNLNQTATAAHQIGQGAFDTKIIPLSEKDILGNAILEMKTSLKAYSEDMEEKVRTRTIEISKQKEIIEAKNEDITASINYAKRIQDAGLPAISMIKTNLPDSFVLFKPRDIVSGDFYWFAKHKNKIIITAVDCTGHGVPGAFMSLIGMNILSAIVIQNDITEANKILDQMHKRVQIALRQETSENNDGMDMALCVIDKTENTIEFAGAKNPLVYIQNDTIYKIDGDKKGIGGKQRITEKFRKHEIKLDIPTTFYLFSDGYQDQFGGPKERKFMKKNMFQMFLDNHKLPMETQKEIYSAKIESWRNDTPQVDDILIIGFNV